MPKRIEEINFKPWKLINHRDQVSFPRVQRLAAVFTANFFERNNQPLSSIQLEKAFTDIFNQQVKSNTLRATDLKKLLDAKIIQSAPKGSGYWIDSNVLECLILGEEAISEEGQAYLNTLKQTVNFYKDDLAEENDFQENEAGEEILSFLWKVIEHKIDFFQDRKLRVLAILIENYLLRDNAGIRSGEILLILKEMDTQNLSIKEQTLIAKEMKSLKDDGLVISKNRKKGYRLVNNFSSHLSEEQYGVFQKVIVFYSPDAFNQQHVANQNNNTLPANISTSHVGHIRSVPFQEWQVVANQRDLPNDRIARVLAILVENYIAGDNKPMSAQEVLNGLKVYGECTANDKTTLAKNDFRHLKNHGLVESVGNSGYRLTADFLQKSKIDIEFLTTLKVNKRTRTLLKKPETFRADELIEKVADFYSLTLFDSEDRALNPQGSAEIENNHNNNDVPPPVDQQSEEAVQITKKRKIYGNNHQVMFKPRGFAAWHFIKDKALQNRAQVTFAILLESYLRNPDQYISASEIAAGIHFYGLEEVDPGSLMKRELKELKNDFGFIESDFRGYRLQSNFKEIFGNLDLTEKSQEMIGALDSIRNICSSMCSNYPESDLNKYFNWQIEHSFT